MICIVGAGKMGKALATGFLASDIAPENLTLVDRQQDRHSSLKNLFPGVNMEIRPVPCDGAVIATKPPDVDVAAGEAVEAGARRIVSVAAGVPLSRISKRTGDVPIARAMPNVGVIVGRSTTSICASDVATRDWAGGLMQRVGTVVFAEEKDFDAVTALGGSGPAFVAFAAQSLSEAGQRAGLSSDVANELVMGMIESALTTMQVADLSPAELQKMVSTPGGTTLAGLAALEANGAYEAFASAVGAAIERSKELAE